MGWSVNDTKQGVLPYAKFLSSNKNINLLKMTMNVTTLNGLNKIAADANRESGLAGAHTHDKIRLFFHYAKYDYKRKFANKNLDYTFIEGVGAFANDFVGSLVYGMWTGYKDQSLSSSLHDGDYIQWDLPITGIKGGSMDGVDDIYDSFAIAVGWASTVTYHNGSVGMHGSGLKLGHFESVLKMNKSVQWQNFYGDDKGTIHLNFDFKAPSRTINKDVRYGFD